MATQDNIILAQKIREYRKANKTWKFITKELSIGIKWAKHLAEFVY